MMKNVFFILISIMVILIFLVSCESKNTRFLKERAKILYNKRMELPYIDNDSLKSLKIGTYVDGNCGDCISRLKLWKEFVSTDSAVVSFLFYFYSTDQQSMEFLDSIYVNMNYPLILDKTKKYLMCNGLNEYEKKFQTFLLDENNKVILFGDPFSDKNIMELYKREILKHKVSKINI